MNEENGTARLLKELQDNLTVIAEIERRHAALLPEHEGSLNDLYKAHGAHNRILNAQNDAILAQIEAHTTTEKTIARLNAESAVFRQCTEQNLAEITDKLNGLIGYVAGIQLPPKN